MTSSVIVQLKNGRKTSSSRANPVTSSCRRRTSHYLSVFPQTLFIHFSPSLLSSPAITPPISDCATASIFFCHLSPVWSLCLSFEATRFWVGRRIFLLQRSPSGSDGGMKKKKQNVNCGEKSRNFVFVLLSSAPRDDGGAFDVRRFHSSLLLSSSFFSPPVVSHPVLSCLCHSSFFFPLCAFLPSIVLNQSGKKKKKKKNFSFQKWELGSGSFQVCRIGAIKSQLSSPFLHLH